MGLSGNVLVKSHIPKSKYDNFLTLGRAVVGGVWAVIRDNCVAQCIG